MGKLDHVGVSVIIPTYLQKDLLIKAVDSVLRQTHENIEIIIVNDNRDKKYEDFILEYISRRPDENIVYLKNEVNCGSSQSRNNGIKHAHHNFISFLDDDDVYYPNKISQQLQQMIEESTDYSVCNIKLVHANGFEDIRERNYLSKKESLLSKHLKYHITATSTFMFKKDLLMEIGGFPESDLGDEFILMTKAICQSDRFSHCDQIGVIAAVHATSGLSSSTNKIKSENDLIKFKSFYYDKLSQEDIRYIRMRHYLVKSMAYYKSKQYLKMMPTLFKGLITSPRGMASIISGNDR